MQNIINPISSNQIVDVPIDLACLTITGCRDLNAILTAMIKELCNLDVEWSNLDVSCIWTSPPATITAFAFYQKILQELCDHKTQLSNLSVPITDTVTLQYCTPDTWTCGVSPCVTVLDNCDNPIVNVTVEDVLQTLVNTVVSLRTQMSLQCDRITALETDVANLQAAVTLIQSTCC